jgi:hypothetical protein
MEISETRRMSALEYADLLHSLGTSYFPLPKTEKEIEEQIRQLVQQSRFSESMTEDKIIEVVRFFYKQHQSPSERGIWDTNLSRIVRLLKESWPTQERHYIDTIPVVDIMQPSLNACAIKAPSGDRVIAFNCQAGLALDRFNLSAFNILANPNDQVTLTREKKYIFSWCLFLLTQDIRVLQEQPVGRMNSDDLVARNRQRIWDLQVQFILAHEYYHHICGHLDGGHTTEVNLDQSRNLVVEYFLSEQECEAEADTKAFTYMQRYWASTPHGPIYLFLVLYAVDMMLSLAQLIEDLLQKLKNCSRGLEFPPTHPMPNIRRAKIMQMSGAAGFPVQKAGITINEVCRDISVRSDEFLHSNGVFQGSWSELTKGLHYRRLFGVY